MTPWYWFSFGISLDANLCDLCISAVETPTLNRRGAEKDEIEPPPGFLLSSQSPLTQYAQQSIH
jgi:hypothetical protein